MLDALLAAQPEIRVDAAFEKVRQNLRQFEGVVPLDSPPGFHGELRPYQREGLGWLDYLQRFGFGGILADDMGLGKTIQVLALLAAAAGAPAGQGAVAGRGPPLAGLQLDRRRPPSSRRGCACSTTPAPAATPSATSFREYDLIVTTYGTVRTDIAELTPIEFDYAILDEAQAIKNAESQSAKAARLLRSRHRLAMSGTPIENHLGELWSIFEFLNPGMLGSDTVFKQYAQRAARALEDRRPRPAGQGAAAVHPPPDQAAGRQGPAREDRADPLLRHGGRAAADLRRAAGPLPRRPVAQGRRRAEPLEDRGPRGALAAPPGRLPPRPDRPDELASEPSAKLDMLLPSIAEVVEEGHKVLVFSQFTSFLAIVRERLDQEKITYEYLDGRTRNRAAKVERFQTDPECPIFLISLKAGGLGLNLTAAEYVYLLDPWWNPAVEAQAIDRSHRIGQTQHVFAYRLICRDTVEEKILELQQKKRDLADAILNADNKGVIQNLTREDLEFLLS